MYLGPLRVFLLVLWVICVKCVMGDSSERRGLQATCKNEKTIDAVLDIPERRFFDVSGFTGCETIEAHQSGTGEFYITITKSTNPITSTPTYFLSKLQSNLSPSYIRNIGTKRRYSVLSQDGSSIFLAYNNIENPGTGNNITLQELNTSDGSEQSERVVAENTVSLNQEFVGMARVPTSDDLYIAGSSMGGKTFMWNLDEAIPQRHIWDFVGRVGRMAAPTSRSRILVQSEDTDNMYLYVFQFDLNNNNNGDLYNVFALSCPSTKCTSNFENSHMLINPDNDAEGFVLIEYHDNDTSITHFVFSHVNIETNAIIKRYYSTSIDIERVESLQCYGNKVYFLISKRFEDLQLSKNVLLIYVPGQEDPFQQTHQCSSGTTTAECKSVYFVSDRFASNNGKFTQMIIDSDSSNPRLTFFGKYQNSCITMQETLSNLNSTLDWETQDPAPTYFGFTPTLGFVTGNDKGDVGDSSNSWSNPGIEDDSEQADIGSTQTINETEPIKVETELSITIKKSKSYKTNIVISCENYDTLGLKYYLISEDKNVTDMIKIDEDTGELTINSTDFTTSPREFDAIIRVNSTILTDNIDISLKIKEELEFGAELEAQQTVIAAAFGASVSIGAVSSFSPNSGFSGIWMIINQQQLLILLTLMDTVIDSDVRQTILGTKFLTLNFKFLDFSNFDFIGIYDFLDQMNRTQQNPGLYDLGYKSISAVQMDIDIFIALTLIFIVQIVVIIFCLFTRRLKKCKRKSEEQNVRPDISFSREENKNASTYRLYEIENTMIKDKHEEDEESERNEFIICCKCFCKCLCKHGCKTVKCICARPAKNFVIWQRKYLPARFFLNVYVRIISEVLFILSATSLNEIIKANFEKYYYAFSFVIAVIMLIMCVLFIIFCFVYFILHFKTDLSDKSKRNIYFDVLFQDLEKGIGRIYNPLALFRKFLFVCIVFFPYITTNLKFALIIIFQCLYAIQTIKPNKFKNPTLYLITIINEGVFLLIVIIFSIWNSIEMWREENPTLTMKEFVMYLIMGNMIAIVVVQLFFLVRDIAKWYKDTFPTDDDLRRVAEEAKEMEEEKKNNQNRLSRVSQRFEVDSPFQNKYPHTSNPTKRHKKRGPKAPLSHPELFEEKKTRSPYKS